MRNLICDYFFWLAKRAQRRSEDPNCDMFWRRAWRKRALFWGDAELLVAGLMDWETFRRNRGPKPAPRHPAIRARWPS